MRIQEYELSLASDISVSITDGWVGSVGRANHQDKGQPPSIAIPIIIIYSAKEHLSGGM